MDRWLTARPAHPGEVAHLLKMPRETVRRKMKRLEEMGLICVRQKGAVISSLAEWQALAHPFTGAQNI